MKFNRILMTRFMVSAVLAVYFILFFFFMNAKSNVDILDSYRNSFQEFVKLDSNGISTGYFQWSDFKQSIESDDVKSFEKWENEILDYYSHISTVEIINGDVNFDTWYEIRFEKNKLYGYFKIFNSEGTVFLQDKIARVEFDYISILDSIKATDKFSFGSDYEGEFIFGITYTDSSMPFTVLQIITIAAVAIMGYFFVFLFENRYFGKFKMLHQLDTLVFLAEKRIKYSEGHSRAVADISYLIGKKMKLKKTDLENMYIAAYLHEIGLLAIPTEKIERSELLDSRDWDYIKVFPEYSEMIINSFECFKNCGEISRSINEKWDGTGFPDGLKGEDINILSRIAGIAHLIEILTRRRNYRNTVYDVEDAVKIIGEMPSDQSVMNVVRDNIEEIKKIIEAKNV